MWQSYEFCKKYYKYTFTYQLIVSDNDIKTFIHLLVITYIHDFGTFIIHEYYKFLIDYKTAVYFSIENAVFICENDNFNFKKLCYIDSCRRNMKS